MKNLLKVFIGTNTELSTPALSATVVIKEANIKYIIKNGNILLILYLELSLVLLLDLYIDKIRVIGIIAKVLVSLTVTALSKVAVPKFHILSQVEATAVTDDVSFTAEPAKIPKASPELVSKPIIFPSIGN